MGCRLLIDERNGCCFYDSVTETAFGPVMRNADQADAFIEHLGVDPRKLDGDELRRRFDKWVADNDDERTFEVCE